MQVTQAQVAADHATALVIDARFEAERASLFANEANGHGLPVQAAEGARRAMFHSWRAWLLHSTDADLADARRASEAASEAAEAAAEAAEANGLPPFDFDAEDQAAEQRARLSLA